MSKTVNDRWRHGVLVGSLCLMLLVGCRGKPLLRFDESFSISLRNLPPPIEEVAEIQIYRTEGRDFLETAELAKLNPVKILQTTPEIKEFFGIMKRGRLSNRNRNLIDVHYLPECYHIVAINIQRTEYGYLKFQISSDRDKPIVARMQVPDGTNSYEFVEFLPAFLQATRPIPLR